MKGVLLSILMVMIILNVCSFTYGKRIMKKVNVGNEEENYKKGMKYVVISLIISFITLVGGSLIAILNIWA